MKLAIISLSTLLGVPPVEGAESALELAGGEMLQRALERQKLGVVERGDNAERSDAGASQAVGVLRDLSVVVGGRLARAL
jgi:hypothetical protein